MPKMSMEEMRAFVMEETRTGHLATVREDDRPHVAPVWFLLDGEDIVFTSWHDTAKIRNLERTDHASLSVDHPHAPYSFVVVEGTVAIERDPSVTHHWATEAGRRYMGEDRAEEDGARNGVEGGYTCRLTPAHWVGARDLAD